MNVYIFETEGDDVEIIGGTPEEAWKEMKKRGYLEGEIELVDTIFYSDGDDDTEDMINGHIGLDDL